MTDVAQLIADLAIAGVDPLLIGRVAQALSEREPVLIRDEQAERRRERDRERRRVRRHPQTSAESADKGSRQEVSPAPLQETQLQTPLSPPKGGSISRLVKPNGFSRFWEAYPRKVGKRAAELAYDRALKRIPGHDPPAEVMAGLIRAKADPKWREEPDFIPHPTTWLNQDRWLDGLTAPPEPPTPEDLAAQTKLRERMIEHALERAAAH